MTRELKVRVQASSLEMAQRGRGRRRAVEEEEEEEEMMDTQTQGEECSQVSRQARKRFDDMDLQLQQRKVSEMVRYLLCAERRKTPVRRKELTEKVLVEYSRAFPVIFERANSQLKKVFGLEAKPVQRARGKEKYYILVNTAPSDSRDFLVVWSQEETAHVGLLSVILSLIMMRQGQITEDQLWNLLKRLGIQPDRSHAKFGDVQKLITKEFVEQMYLEREKKQVGESHVFLYRWGPRAEVEVDKKELLAFVAETHGGDLSQWERQFRDIIEGPTSSQPPEATDS